MKEEIHQMLDGDLPDDAMAELLHLLSVDPEKRRLFRQQMVLQHALVRNEANDMLTPGEDLEMLSNLSRAVGINTPGSGGWKSWVAVGMLSVGLFVGGGAGYLLGASADAELAARKNFPAENIQIPSPPIVIEVPINRDSIITALRDSIAALPVEKPAVTAAAPKRNKPAITRRPPRTGGGNDDLTGANEVRDAKKKKGKN